ncbi:MAG: restriction endonuclease subunit S [Candidatus Methanosuratincola petrocarbonis]
MLFYKETEFQDTPIGQAPKDWQVLKLGDDDVCEDIFYGITAKATEQNTGLRMLRTTDIKNYTADWGKLPFCEVTENRSALDKYIIKRGDIIIARAGTVGVSVLVNRDFTDVIFGSYLIKVRLKSSIIPEFAHYFLQSNLYWKHIQKAQGSTLKNINLPILKELSLPIPSLEEQRAIVGVLGVVDSVIAKTGEVIAKTERLKKGLMQTLLTRGIGHKEYKQTPIGTIPKEWEVNKVSDLFDVLTGTTPSTRQSEYWNEGTVNWLTPTDLSKLNGKIHIKNSERKITERALQETNLTLMPKGSIIISTRAPVGYVAVLEEPTAFNQGCKGLIPKKHNGILSEFYCYYLLNKKQMLENLSSGSTFKELSKERLQNFNMPSPSFTEQKKIAELLLTIDKKLDIERSEKVRLEYIKRGLMDLLLAGKIRVKAV